jgi:hypothetical protein
MISNSDWRNRTFYIAEMYYCNNCELKDDYNNLFLIATLHDV